MYGKDGRWYTVRHPSVGKQLETYRYLCFCVDSMGYSPTLREVAEEVHVSEATAKGYLRELEKAGLIKRNCPNAGSIMISKMEDFGNVIM